jgi:hypothetical protein
MLLVFLLGTVEGRGGGEMSYKMKTVTERRMTKGRIIECRKTERRKTEGRKLPKVE